LDLPTGAPVRGVIPTRGSLTGPRLRKGVTAALNDQSRDHNPRDFFPTRNQSKHLLCIHNFSITSISSNGGSLYLFF
jgi:hypothetical protein